MFAKKKSRPVKVEVEPVPAVIDDNPKEGFCVERGCDRPVAPGQTYVCLTHKRRG